MSAPVAIDDAYRKCWSCVQWWANPGHRYVSLTMRALLSLLGAATALAAPSAAHAAATVTHDAADYAYIYRTDAYDISRLTVTEGLIPREGSHRPAMLFRDGTVPQVAGDGCEGGPAEIRCAPLTVRGGLDTDVFISLGWGDDAVNADLYFVMWPGRVGVDAGYGDDRVRVDGDNTWVSGGPGDDRIGAFSDRHAVAAGGTGDDTITSGTGEDVAWIRGQDGADLIAGYRGYGKLEGNNGDDVVGARGFQDLYGGDGDDVLLGARPGTIDGGSGNDVIATHSPFTGTQVLGRGGNDWIDATDDAGGPRPPSFDTVDCGAGDDTAYADAGDEVAANCEHVIIGPAPANAAVDAAQARIAAALKPGWLPF
jgi:hypothetical protein